MSMDGRALKLWNEHTGQPFTSVEPGTDLNDFVRYKNSGMIVRYNLIGLSFPRNDFLCQ